MNINEIERLNNLRKDGAISQEEFEMLKEELLNNQDDSFDANDQPEQFDSPTPKKRRARIKTILAIGLVAYILYISFQDPAFKQGMFSNCEEFGDAVIGVRYDRIVEEFGEPDSYSINYGDEEYHAVWNELGVNGQAYRVVFAAGRYTGTNQYFAVNDAKKVFCF